MSFARPTWEKVGIALALWSNMILVANASELRILKKIEVFSFEKTDEVRLEFDKKFSEIPQINFDSGSITFGFHSTHTDPNLPPITPSIDYSLIKEVRAFEVPETHFVHLEILLRSPKKILGYPKITHSKNHIKIGFSKKISTKHALSTTGVLTKEIEKRVKEDTSLPYSFSKKITDEQSPLPIDGLISSSEKGWTTTMLTLISSLLLVLFLIYLIAFLYKRFFKSRFPSMKGNMRIRQVSSYYVGPKQKIIVFEMNERKFACGVTPSSINLIAELYNETNTDNLHSIQNDERTNKFSIDPSPDSQKINLEQSFEQTKTTTSKNKNSKENLDTSIELEGFEKNIFLKSNAENIKNLEESKIHNDELNSTVRTNFSETPVKNQIMPSGNQMMQDFASRLSERLKFLKPIK